MRLAPNPSPDLISYVERIQRRLSRHRAPLGRHNEEFLEAVRALARKQRPEDLHDLPEHLRPGFGMLNPQELERRVDEVSAMSTPFQNAATLLQLLDLWYEVEHFVGGVSKDYGQRDAPLFLATAPHWSHNARAFTHPPSGVHVLVFYDRLFDFIKDVSLALPLAVLPQDIDIPDIAAFPSLATTALDRQTDPSPAAARSCLQHFLKRHHERDFEDTLNIGTVSESIRILAQDIELSMQAFVVGHEIAHILCRHEGEDQLWALPPSEDDADAARLSERIQTHDQELEADYIGFKLGHGVTIGFQIPFITYVWSVLLFFNANEWLMRLSGWGEEQLATLPEDERFRVFGAHPPFSLRTEWILKIVETAREGPRLDLRPLEKLARLV